METKRNMSPLDIIPSKENIWNFRQNHPELVVKDLKEMMKLSGSFYQVPPTDSALIFYGEWFRRILMSRGVNKWFAVRRDLIAYKKQKKHQIREKLDLILELKAEIKLLEPKSAEFYKKLGDLKVARAELKILEEVRGSLKSMCMRDRWQDWKGKKLQDMNEVGCSD